MTLLPLWAWPLISLAAGIVTSGLIHLMDWLAGWGFRKGPFLHVLGTALGIPLFFGACMTAIASILGFGGTIIWVWSWFDPGIICHTWAIDCPSHH